MFEGWSLKLPQLLVTNSGLLLLFNPITSVNPKEYENRREYEWGEVGCEV